MKSIHHSFDIDLATIYGINAAIIIHHFQHWIRLNQKLKRNFHEGRTWSYQTLDEIAAHFPYFSKDEVFEIIELLCTGKGRRSKKEKGFDPVLLKGNFNKVKFDRTTWYSFKNEKMFTVLAQAKMEDGASQNPSRLEPTPIPDTKPDTKNKQNSVNPANAAPLPFPKGKKKEKHPTEDESAFLIFMRNDIKKLFGDVDTHSLLYFIQRYGIEEIRRQWEHIKSQKDVNNPMALMRFLLEEDIVVPDENTKAVCQIFHDDFPHLCKMKKKYLKMNDSGLEVYFSLDVKLAMEMLDKERSRLTKWDNREY